jgi:hypothetical protein
VTNLEIHRLTCLHTKTMLVSSTNLRWLSSTHLLHRLIIISLIALLFNRETVGFGYVALSYALDKLLTFLTAKSKRKLVYHDVASIIYISYLCLCQSLLLRKRNLCSAHMRDFRYDTVLDTVKGGLRTALSLVRAQSASKVFLHHGLLSSCGRYFSKPFRIF